MIPIMGGYLEQHFSVSTNQMLQWHLNENKQTNKTFKLIVGIHNKKKKLRQNVSTLTIGRILLNRICKYYG